MFNTARIRIQNTNKEFLLCEISCALGSEKCGTTAELTIMPTMNMDKDTRERLQMLMFGCTEQQLQQQEDFRRWEMQGFVFYPASEYLWGLEQSFGGPCGVLAVVQAFILKDLFFTNPCPSTTLTTVSPQRRDQAFANALSSILLNANTECTSIPLVSGYPQLSLEYIPRHSLSTHISSNLAQVLTPSSVLCFVYSVLLTRGLAQVRADRDDPFQPLIQSFGHSSQDLVNLLLTGRAVSNLHDGDQSLGGDIVLRGISRRNEIGLLSTLHVMKYVEIGDNLIYSQLPIWILSTDLHYSIVFGVDQSVCNMSRKELLFHEARRLFHVWDRQGNGFIDVKYMDEFVQGLGMDDDASEMIKANLDKDGLGIILWQTFHDLFLILRSDGGKDEESLAHSFTLYYYNGLQGVSKHVQSIILRVDENQYEYNDDVLDMLSIRYPRHHIRYSS